MIICGLRRSSVGATVRPPPWTAPPASVDPRWPHRDLAVGRSRGCPTGVTTYDPIERVRRARREAATLGAPLAFVGLLLVIGIFRSGRALRTAGVQRGSSSWSAALRAGSALGGVPPGHDLPESLSAGPAAAPRPGGGFARSQLGAALAAMHIGHRIDPASGPGVFEPTIREQFVGPDAGKLLEKTSASYEALRHQEDN